MVEVMAAKQGYVSVVKPSANAVSIQKRPITEVKNGSAASVTKIFGEFKPNSVRAPDGFAAKIKATVLNRRGATSVTCIGIVSVHGSKSWQRAVGLKRAALACSIAKKFNSSLRTKLTWQTFKLGSTVKRGVAMKFNK
jgi:hypothetical protein